MISEKKNIQVKQPKYQKIAVDLASKIVAGRYEVGERIYARSSLASQYGVSAETARRAVAVLQDLEIVAAFKGSGVVITSYEKAAQFVQQYGEVQSVREIQEDLLTSIQRQHNELNYLQETMATLISRTEQFKAINPFVPFQLKIPAACKHIGESLQTLNFWHNTSATIVAIRSADEMLLSPGPYAVFKENDTIYFIGNEASLERVKNFLL